MSEMKSMEKKTMPSDPNSTIMRPTAKAPAAAAKPANAPPHVARMEANKQTEHAVEKAIAETKAATPAKAEAKPAAAPAKKEEKKEVKEEKKSSTNKPAKKKGKKATWVKKIKVKKSEAAKDVQETINGKWKPNFWGRFGKKNLRTQRDPKYAKWRKPRGIDILRERNDGELPNSGFRTPRAIRGMHPSGYAEVLVRTQKDLDAIKAHQAARFVSTLGRKKRIALTQYANTKNIPILN